MKRGRRQIAWLGLAAYACCVLQAAGVSGPRHATTSGAIAIANLDQQILRAGGAAGTEDYLLMKSRFLSDYDALDRAVSIAEVPATTADGLLRRARVRSAVHRFDDALADLDAAVRAGASEEAVSRMRASILVATGRSEQAIPLMELDLSLRPGLASRTSLAAGYAAVGRFAEADRLHAAALAGLETTSPFPYAWVHFARGMMWAEQAADPIRGEACYKQALAHLPQFATANIHMAEIEAGRGDLATAMARLERVVAAGNEPEALALLGELKLRVGDRSSGLRDIEMARQRYESLLDRHPLAFADHAAEFYLGAGQDPQRAWTLAKQNLENRKTPRALALAVSAAKASGRDEEACMLLAGAHPGGGDPGLTFACRQQDQIRHARGDVDI